MKNEKVWFVTGASKGLGQVLVQELLAKGYKVAATTRNRAALIQAIGESKDFLALEMDLSNEKSVAAAVDSTLKKFGRLDVVVNNAGYGQGGAVEEVTDQEAQDNFGVNVFGLLNVIRGTVPQLRKQKSGQIFNVSSIGGFVGNFSGWGVYCATKFAVAGLTESLNSDLKGFGVHATVVYPGYFRTNFLEKDSLKLPKAPIADYREAQESMKKHANEINHNQPGDPVKAAKVMIEVSEMQKPPLHLFLGPDAFEMAQTKIGELKADLERMKELSISTNFEK